MSVGLKRSSSALSLLSYKSQFTSFDEEGARPNTADNVCLTKIVATLGPATQTEKAIGFADFFLFSLSHILAFFS